MISSNTTPGNPLTGCHRRLPAALLICIATLWFGGCVPVLWLPDSSGFLYTSGKNFDILMHYDLATGEMRKLATTDGNSPTPALSPDGKQVAVGTIIGGEGDDDHEKLLFARVMIHDLKGKETHRSKVFNWNQAGEKDPTKPPVTENASQRAPVLLGWAGDTIAMTPAMSSQKIMPLTCLYEPATGKVRMFSGQACAIGGTLFRPDGKGMLLVQSGNMAWLDTAGSETKIPIHPDVLEKEERRKLLMAPWSGISHWEGNKAVIQGADVRIVVDTSGMAMSCEIIKEPQKTGDGKAIEQEYRLGDAIVRILSESEGERKRLTLEVSSPGAPPQRALAGSDGFMPCPSPDGKWLLIRSLTDAAEHSPMVLVDGRGTMKHLKREERDRPRPGQ